MFENVRNTTETIVCEGPVRTIVDITNKGWRPTPDCKPVDIVTRYILYYGHRDVEVQVKFSRPVPDLQLSTGIVDIVEGSEEFSDKAGLRGDWGTACAGNGSGVRRQMRREDGASGRVTQLIRGLSDRPLKPLRPEFSYSAKNFSMYPAASAAGSFCISSQMMRGSRRNQVIWRLANFLMALPSSSTICS